ncbi:MAG: putative disulfide bond formation protein D [Candidatus Dojkabacteria bacterium]|nr:MAG: putative disulfide bond formation protein D [Candidatus Dojkabacteria bacterium]
MENLKNIKNYLKHPAVITLIALLASVAAIFGIIQILPENNTSQAERVERFWGNPEASVVIEYYGDLECPACKAFWFDTEKRLKETYSDKIKFIFKHLPLPIHARADDAAEAAEAAGAQGKFFEYVEILYSKQSSEEVQKWNVNTFVEYAKEVGISDIEKFKKELEDKYYRNVINEYKREAKEKNIMATPTVYVNGKQITNPTFENIEKAILESLGNTVTPSPSEEPQSQN